MTTFVQRPTTRAIPIVAPSAVTTPSTNTSPTKSLLPQRKPSPKQNGARKTPKCRNLTIYGYCKNEGKGCIYDHADGSATPLEAPSEVSGSTASAMMATPSTASVNANAPIFVPKTSTGQALSDYDSVSSPELSKSVSVTSRPSGDSFHASESAPAEVYDYNTGNSVFQTSYPVAEVGGLNLDDGVMSYADNNPYAPQNVYYSSDPNAFYPAASFHHEPLQYHLYTPLPYVPRSQIPGTHNERLSTHRFFMSDTIREDLQRRSEAIYAIAPPPAPMLNGKTLPEEVHVYHSLVALENIHVGNENQRRKWFMGCPSQCYRAIKKDDGGVVLLRRIEGFRLTQETAFGPVDTWHRVKHPNVVNLREAFTTKAFGDYSLVFVYDFHPLAQTLYNAHISQLDTSLNPALPQPVPPSTSPLARSARAFNSRNKNRSNPGSTGSATPTSEGGIEERVLWSYITQIANAMKDVHSRGLAFRTLDVSKVLLTGKNRVRVNCCGIFDVLTHGSAPGSVPSVAALQQEDLLAFGRLILALCTRNAAAWNNANKAMEHISHNYSADLKNAVLFLSSKPASGKVIDQLLDMLGTRLLTEMNAMQSYADQLENEMMGELENGRLLRIMSKLGFINERPDFTHELRWSDTGDRYIISLFRDYVFHQVDEMGRPVVNLTHVVSCLNKLDAGTEERIMLISRDEQTCLVVSYKEIKACIESAFGELTAARAGLPPSSFLR